MRNFIYLLFSLFFINQEVLADQYFNVFSPDKKLQLNFYLSREGIPYYSLNMDNSSVLKRGRLGIQIASGDSFDEDFELERIDTISKSEPWSPIWGEEKHIASEYIQMLVSLRQAKYQNRLFQIEFKLFNNGLGFRYLFSDSTELNNFIICDELTSFPLSADHKAFWIPGDYDTNEFVYSYTKLSDIHCLKERKENDISFKSPISDSTVQTPFTMKAKGSYFISIHEAGLINYPAMNLDVNRSDFTLKCNLVPDPHGNKAYLHSGDRSPWRVILLARKAGELLTNRVIINLNEPSKLVQTDYIKPGKFVGVWWEMHVGKSSWSYSNKINWNHDSDILNPSGKHGATNENVKRYIDFASQNKLDYVLVEGWNRGWENWYGSGLERVFSFTKSYPDFDMQLMSDYAKSRNVKLIMHHETSAAVTDYEWQLENAFQLTSRFNYGAIKTGYVGKIIPRGEHHDGQWMVNHYNRIAAKAATYNLMLDVHEPVRPTGLHRTYPNLMACEAARGNEFNAWSLGNPPDHETILPFTRLLGGPMDYTPGIFEIKMNVYNPTKTEQVHTTLCKQLALYVTMYCPLQMAADLIENYEKRMDAFQFIKDVPTNWDTTIVLDAEPGDFLYMARKERNQSNWFVGAITDEKPRELSINFSFLHSDKKYQATIYRDADKADWKNNPMEYKIEQRKIGSTDKMKIKLAPGGGCAISLIEIKN
ncbi:MAG: glycoside hydrolase family 97 protein [Saprospiraceae bacterium]|jgi:hypothetical protein